MMRTIVVYMGMLMAVVLFTSCGNSDGRAENNLERGSFKATMGEKSYEVDVVCSHLNESYFKFRSDKRVDTDSNEDGLIISGVEMNRRLILTIIDHGKKYQTKNMAVWEKDSDGATGSGILYNEAVATDSRQTTFKMSCR